MTLKPTLLFYYSLLLTTLTLVTAQTNCFDSGYFCGKELRLKYHNIYWCQDTATNPHVVVDNCFDECVPNPDRSVMPACVAPSQEVIVFGESQSEPAPEPEFLPVPAPEGEQPVPEGVLEAVPVEGEVGV